MRVGFRMARGSEDMLEWVVVTIMVVLFVYLAG